ncbi:MAG: alpha-galactosidase [Clostridiales bacterium]|jgi:alpha-galactosidase|nr:alpha-galactosidase [Clostridiales bacterium]
MGVKFFEDEKLFKLDTPLSTYAISIVYEEKLIAHTYYGKRIGWSGLNYLLGGDNNQTMKLASFREKGSVLDRLPMEYPTSGLGDFRESGVEIYAPYADTENSATDGNSGNRSVNPSANSGNYGFMPSYISHKIYRGKPKLLGLPATFAGEGDCETLEIECEDTLLNINLTLVYNVFNNLDVITRHVKIKNNSQKSVYLKKVMSACADLPNNNFEMLRLSGSWARERSISRVPIGCGHTGASSLRGESSHQSHPFFALVSRGASQDTGEVYGFHLVYSGNFSAMAELTQFDRVRAVIGINPYNFSWELAPSGEFTSPEAVLTYSSEGLGKMTRTLHDLYRNHLVRGKYKNAKRPVLINNWEGTYFNFNTEKLLDIARESAKLGIEMLVLDDGWFGKRGDDNSSLGDWFVNTEKLPQGLNYLVSEINKLGMKFGIWMEPEMVSPNSDLYRAHPDWAFQIPGRAPTLSRNQMVLDLSRRDVIEYVYGCISSVLKSANIEYLKWDMNRPLTDVFSGITKNQGEIYHRYMLGVYELQERLITDFPNLLLENCSGGGGRFDPGMLHYGPQFWCSDDTDAIERLKIQEGTALIYPLSTIGAHVSDCPNHIVGRVTPFETRGIVALAGTFGYELDVTKLSESDKAEIPKQIEAYHKYNELVRGGDYYRVASYSENKMYDCYMCVAKDKSEALVTFVNVLARPGGGKVRIKLKGLDENSMYQDVNSTQAYSGAALMYGGLDADCGWGDFKAQLIHIKAV